MRGEFVLLRWSAWSLRNQIRSIRATHGAFDLLALACACLLLAIYFVSRIDALLVHQAAVVRAHWPLVNAAAAGFAMVAGVAAGWGAYRRALRRASAAWMAALPMPQVTRSWAVTLAALAAVPWQASLAGLLAAWVGIRGGNDGPARHALAFVAVFASGFVAVVFIRQRWRSTGAARITAQPDGAAPPAAKRPHWIGWLRGIDTARPRWIGVWDCGQHARWQTFVILAVFAVFGSLSIGASIVQRWSLPALGVGVVGGNLVFVLVLRGVPLRSPVCRASPLGFVAAWAGLTRLPLALSAAWFLPLAAVGAAAQHGGRSTVVAGTLALLGGNLTYAVLVAFSPASPVLTMTVYAGLLATAASETLELGQSTLLVLMAFLAFLWWLGRRKYRSGG